MAHGPHHDHHGHIHEPQKLTLAFLMATLLNLSLVIFQLIFAYLAHSMSLLSDAGHNLGDVLGIGMSGVALWLTKRKATERYSYGFKRTTILAALFNALLLIATTFFIIGESINKLIHPSPVNEILVIIVALIGIFINGGTALLFLKGQEDLNIKSAFLHLFYDALLSLSVAITGVIILWSKWSWLDPLVGILIALFILYGTWSLLKQSLALILDAVPHHIDQQAVLNYFESVPYIKAAHDLHIWALSTNEAALTVHLAAQRQEWNEQSLEKIYKDLAEQFHIHHVTIQVEYSDEKFECNPC